MRRVAETAEKDRGLAAGDRARGGESPGLHYYLLALSLCFMWGVTFTAMKVALSGAGPYSVAWVRQLLAGFSIILYLKITLKDVSLTPASWVVLLINVLLYALSNAAIFVGLDQTTASRGAVILYTQPLFVAFLAHFLLKGERLGMLKLFGVALAFFGVLLIFSQKLGRGALRGDLFVLVSAILWALQTVYLKRYLSKESPFLVAAWQALAGFLPILALGLLLEGPPSIELRLSVILAILYCGPVSMGFALVLWVKLLQGYPATRLSSFLFLTPVFGVLIAHLTLGDPLGEAMILGVALVCGGIYLVNRPVRKSP